MPVWLITDVDTEFDCLRPGYTGDWRKDNPGLTKGVAELLQFFQEKGIRATFHIQEQSDENQSILRRYPEVYELVSKYGQEISVHVHVREAGYAVREREITAAVNRVREHGYNISSFKAGWYFSNENTIKVLEALGIEYDCSPLKNSVTGPVRWYDIPDSPYHPSYADITKVGNAKVLVIPITNTRLGIAIHENKTQESELMKKGTEALVSVAERMAQPVILYFTTHSWKPIEIDGSDYRQWEIQRRNEFFDFLFQYEVKSLSVSEAGRLWKEGGYEPYYIDLPDLLGSYRSPFNPLRHFWLVKNVLSRLYTTKYHLLKKL